MNSCLREMLGELAATRERERILAIASLGLGNGQFDAAVALASNPEMTVEKAAELLAGRAAP